LLVFLIAAAIAGGCASGTKDAVFTGEPSKKYIEEQCRFGPRTPGSKAHDKEVRFISAHLKDCGADVTYQRFTRDDPYGEGTLTFTNIIGSFAPDRKKRVLLGAHYDTRPRADQEKADSLRSLPIPGANDGASGVAVLLEIADLLSVNMPKGLGVDLVFFDGEDYGKEADLEYYLLGSKYFAANLGGYRPACAIVLDMVCAADAEFLPEGNSRAGAPDLTAEVYRRARTLGLGVFHDGQGQFVYDDHIPLLLAGIPSVDIIDFPYTYWHTLEDAPDKCSVETLRQVGVLVADILYNFSF
jgi:glutaminyl-peptide cyclotransferase